MIRSTIKALVSLRAHCFLQSAKISDCGSGSQTGIQTILIKRETNNVRSSAKMKALPAPSASLPGCVALGVVRQQDRHLGRENAGEISSRPRFSK